MLTPLPVGEHTIHITVDSTHEILGEALDTQIDSTVHINVVPHN
jgi:hypothetical protein